MEEYKTIANEVVLQLQFTVPLFCPHHLSNRYLETPQEPASFTAFVNMYKAVPAYLTAHQGTSLTFQPLLQQAMCLFHNF